MRVGILLLDFICWGCVQLDIRSSCGEEEDEDGVAVGGGGKCMGETY